MYINNFEFDVLLLLLTLFVIMKFSLHTYCLFYLNLLCVLSEYIVRVIAWMYCNYCFALLEWILCIAWMDLVYCLNGLPFEDFIEFWSLTFKSMMMPKIMMMRVMLLMTRSMTRAGWQQSIKWPGIVGQDWSWDQDWILSLYDASNDDQNFAKTVPFKAYSVLCWNKYAGYGLINMTLVSWSCQEQRKSRCWKWRRMKTNETELLKNNKTTLC